MILDKGNFRSTTMTFLPSQTNTVSISVRFRVEKRVEIYDDPVFDSFDCKVDNWKSIRVP